MKNYALSSPLLATTFLTLFSTLQAGYGEFELRNTTGLPLRVQGTDSQGYSKDFYLNANSSQHVKITGNSESTLEIPNLRKQFKEVAGGDQKKENENRIKYSSLDMYDRMVQNRQKTVLSGGWLSFSDTFILTHLPQNSTHWLLREVTEERSYTTNARKYKALIGFEVVADPDFSDEGSQEEPQASSVISSPAATPLPPAITLLDNVDEGGKEPIAVNAIVTTIPEIEADKPEQILDTAFFQSNEPIELTPHLRKVIQKKLEGMTVDENPMEGGNPEAGSKVIRRTWEDYAKKYGNRRAIVLQSGHKGLHSRTYNTSQSQEYYMIDMCWEEVGPDAVLDVNNPRHMAYLPSGEVNLIVSDDSRGLSNNAVTQFASVLKIGGKIFFKPGTGMGWPAYEFSPFNTPGIQFDDSGRYAWSNNNSEINSIHKSKNAKEKFVSDALKLAVPYYTERGYSQVEYDPASGCFVLTK